MKTKSLLFIMAVSVWGLAATVRADIRPPGKNPQADKPSVPLVVKTDETREVSILRIGREALKQSVTPPPGRRAEWLPGSFRNIVAAVALSLGFAAVFLLRGRRGLATTVALLVGAIIATAAVQAWGDIPPFPRGGRPIPPPVNDYRGRVVIEIVDNPAAEAELIIGTMAQPQRVPEPPRAAPRRAAGPEALIARKFAT